MNIVAIYGTERKQTTYHFAEAFLRHLNRAEDRVDRFFLPRDMPHFCVGCVACMEDGDKCPHIAEMGPIRDALEAADVILLASPVYVLHASGQMKAFLDHMAFRFMVHRPAANMFRAQGIIVSQAAGGGTGSAVKDMADSLDFWGVARRYTYRANVRAASWKDVSDTAKEKLERDAARIAATIRRRCGKPVVSMKIRGLFYAMRMMHKKAMFSKTDAAYWEKQGWLGNIRPWNPIPR